MTDTNKARVTGDGAVELDEAALNQASGAGEPPDPIRDPGIIAVNKINPGAIGGQAPPDPIRTRTI